MVMCLGNADMGGNPIRTEFSKASLSAQLCSISTERNEGKNVYPVVLVVNYQTRPEADKISSSIGR